MRKINTFNLKTANKNVNICIDNTPDMSGFTSLFSHCLKKTQKVLLITDSNVDSLHGKAVVEKISAMCSGIYKFVFDAGEDSKNLDTVIKIYSALGDGRFTRTDCIVALGGGVTGDIAGFAAATYMRGIDYYQIPTTLLAQIDSSIGGKTGVDLYYGKNLVGAFYQPCAVYIAPAFLKTLPERELRCGLSEAIKYGCISDKSVLDDIENGNLTAVTAKCVAVKVGVVSRDEFDKGERMILNFGHTVGHAIEKYMNFRGITHGEAVAVGMVYALKAGVKLGVTSADVKDKVVSLLEKVGLPTKTDIPFSDLVDIMKLDKKSAQGEINFILIGSLGTAEIKKLTAEEICSLAGEKCCE